jgi:hypothetical protein
MPFAVAFAGVAGVKVNALFSLMLREVPLTRITGGCHAPAVCGEPLALVQVGTGAALLLVRTGPHA